MKFLQYTVACLGLLAAAPVAVHAQNATNTSGAAPQDSTPVMKIRGQVVSEDALTSLASQIAQFETGFPPDGQDLLNEYILTHLAHDIPTTASVPPAPEPDAEPYYSNVMARNFLKRRLREKLTQETEVPREELEAWYEENKTTYQRPEEVYAWHIFMETSDENETSSPERVRERLQQVKSQVDSGTSFSVAAQQHSEAASKEKGGLIGRIRPRQPIGPLNKPMNIELEQVFFSLPVGQASDVVDTRHGMHLLYITDKKTTVTPTVDDLLTSGILPGTLAQSKVTSAILQLVEEAREKYNAQLLPGFDENSTLTTETVVYTVAGEPTTQGEMAAIFGPRYVSYVERISSDHETLRNLMEQGLQDELTVRAAVDAGLLDDPGVKTTIDGLVQRDRAMQRVNAIVEAEATVSDAQIREKYEELLDQLRRPEAEGYVVVVHGTDSRTTDPAEQARAREQLMQQARELASHMEGADVEAMKAFVASRPETSATVELVTRHVVNQATEPLVVQFDRAMVTVGGGTGVSQPTPSGTNMVLAKVEARHPGEPIALEEVADRIQALMQNEVRQNVRKDLIRRLEDAGLVELLPGAARYQGPPDLPGQAPAGPDEQTTAAAAATTAPASQASPDL